MVSRARFNAVIFTVAMGLAPLPALAIGSSGFPLADDPSYREAQNLIKEGRYREALPILTLLELEHSNSADVHNLLGVTFRKLKDYPRSKVHYDRALAIDFAHLPTLEYQGEWFIETGDLPSARKNLETLKAFCGRCHEYLDLEAAIAAAEKP